MINPSTPPIVSAELEFEALESFPWLSHALDWIIGLSLGVVKIPSGCEVSLGCLFAFIGASLGWIITASMQPPLGIYTYDSYTAETQQLYEVDGIRPISSTLKILFTNISIQCPILKHSTTYDDGQRSVLFCNLQVTKTVCRLITLTLMFNIFSPSSLHLTPASSEWPQLCIPL